MNVKKIKEKNKGKTNMVRLMYKDSRIEPTLG